MASILWIHRGPAAEAPPSLADARQPVLRWQPRERRLEGTEGQELSDEELIRYLDQADLVVCW